MYRYRVFGLNVASELNCPQLPQSDFSEPDVEVRYGFVPEVLEDKMYSRPRFDVGTTSTLLRMPKAGRFLIDNGRVVVIHPENNAEPGIIRMFLLGSSLGVILYQRGITPLHGSAVSHEEGAIVICGQSGAGKSTTAAVLASRGHSIMSDDVSALSIEKGKVVLAPSYPQLRLWENSLPHLRIQHQGCEKVRHGKPKHLVRITDNFETESKPVHALIWLDKQAVAAPGMQQLAGSTRFDAVSRNVYRKEFFAFSSPDQYFNQCRRIAGHLPIWSLVRPENDDSIDAVADLVEAHCRAAFPIVSRDSSGAMKVEITV